MYKMYLFKFFFFKYLVHHIQNKVIKDKIDKLLITKILKMAKNYLKISNLVFDIQVNEIFSTIT